MAVLVAVVAAVISYYLNSPIVLDTAATTGAVFVNLLKLLSLPTMFLSVVSTLSGVTLGRAKRLIASMSFYTLLTTTIASLIALVVYLLLDPAKDVAFPDSSADVVDTGELHYGKYLSAMFPDNFAKVFLDNNVVGCMILAFLLGGGEPFHFC
ncbi:MAG: cation:dicarboxylate symporter family transporter [Anaplasma sp.]